MPMRLAEPRRCLFCLCISGESDVLPVIAAGETTVSFVNPRQFEHGQALVVTRRHAPTILDLTPGEAASLMEAVRQTAHTIARAYDPDGMTIYQNNGVASFQEIPHVHVHVVPRREGSAYALPPQISGISPAVTPPGVVRPPEELRATAAEIAAHAAAPLP